MAAAPLDPVTLTDVMSTLVRTIDLLRLDARVFQLVTVLDAGAQFPVLLHHHLLHILVVAIQQRLRQRGRFEALRCSGVAIAGGVGRVTPTCRACLIVGTTAQVLRATAAARPASVYRRHTLSR